MNLFWAVAFVISVIVLWALAVCTVINIIALGIRWAFRDCAGIGDDVVTIFCRCCDEQPDLPCTCIGDCGRRYCRWATFVSDPEFHRELAALLGESEPPR